MCGVFGWQYSEDPGAEWRTVVGTLLALGAEKRGRHSSGFACYDPKDGKLWRYRENREYSGSGLLTETCSHLSVIGHTRFATVGAQTVENAHPFFIERADKSVLIGAHNGGIYNYREIAEKYDRDAKEYRVDSMHLLRHIADGIDCAELDGYGTVEWMDTRDREAIYLCAMRNGDLAIELLPDNGGVVWASTREIVGNALRAVGAYATSKTFHEKTGVVYRIHDGVIAETDMRINLEGGRKAKGGTRGQVWIGGAWYDDIVDYYQGRAGVNRPAQGTLTPIRESRGPRDSYTLAAYNREVAAYNREVGKLVERKTDGLTRREKKEYSRLIDATAHHKDFCKCTPCKRLFELASKVAMGSTGTASTTVQ